MSDASTFGLSLPDQPPALKSPTASTAPPTSIAPATPTTPVKSSAETFGLSVPIYYNDAGQPFTSSGAIAQPPAKPETSYTGAVLPLRVDQTGTHLAVPRMITGAPEALVEMVEAPIRGIYSMAERGAPLINHPADLKGHELQNPLRPLSLDELAGAMAIGGLRSPASAAARDVRRAAAPLKEENKARNLISSKFSLGESYGAPGAVDVMERMSAARREGQPYTLSDIENTELKSLLGPAYRQGGPARQEMRSFYEGRNTEARGRMKGLLGRYLSNDSMLETADELQTLRSTTGRALWNDAFQGGSLAPLEQQYQAAWVKTGQDEAAALQRLNQAQQAVKQAAGRQSIARDAYSTSGANTQMQQAQLQLREAQEALATAQSDKALTLEKLQTSQIDRATAAPGGIWSPYLERLFQQPEIKTGLRRGFAIQRRDAVGENVPFNPKEYALDAEGNPISVPNMRTWAVAKKGLDAIVNSPSMRDPMTGRLTENGVSYLKLRNGLVSELDRLNPSYKQAREHWGGYTASIRALNDGKNAFKEARFSPEELQKHFNSLEDSDRQFFLIGLADELRTRLRRVGDSSDKSKIINEDARERLSAIFGGNDEQASRFMDAVEREAQMKKTPTEIYGNSPTAGRLADDWSWMEAVGHGLRGMWHLTHGNPLLATGMGLRALGRWWGGHPDLARNEAIAKLMTDPNIANLIATSRAATGGGGPILPPRAIPRGDRPSTRVLPGMALGSQVSDPSDLIAGEQRR